MSEKRLPLEESQFIKLVSGYPKPFHLYDEKAIRENIREFKEAFSWVENFKNYFAVKALPNPSILKIMKEEGFGADCSSLAELIMAKEVGLKGEDVMFTSNDTPTEEFKYAYDMGAIINLDDITHIEVLNSEVKIPSLISFRYNPGPDRSGNVIIGNPVEAKYG
ncbi:MAG: diaminopimelate decarboxylase, partial [Sphaerochaetaceae bacterium]